MTIHLMVNWREEKIMTRKDYEEKEIPATVESWENDPDVLAEWLEDNYYPYDVWVMSDDERDSTWKQFQHHCRERALTELVEIGWEDFWLEI